MASVCEVVPRSPAHKAGIKAGDCLIAINGHPIRDVLDYRYYSYDSHLRLEFETESGKNKTVKIRHSEGGDLGLVFESYLMDKKMSCRNRCIFCFIDQLPDNMRETLYFKDDDARLSFLQGNYVTLTNLDDHDAQRIIAQRVSPINISVHTTDPDLRVRMLRNKRAGEVLKYIKDFAEHNIRMHAQIVLCPGYNDGGELRHTLKDLAQYIPHMESVSIVPVGLTRFREELTGISPVSKDIAEESLDIIHSFHKSLLRKYNKRFFYPADELFLIAREPLPGGDYYDGYPQYENGVGLITSLFDEFKDARDGTVRDDIIPFSIATGKAAEPFLSELIDGLPGMVYAIQNRVFGSSINVAGLICGKDIVYALTGKELGERLLIPSVMLRQSGDMFLDDMTPSELSEMLEVPVVVVPVTGNALWNAIVKAE